MNVWVCATASVALVTALGACSRAPAVENGVATDEAVAAIALPEEQLRAMLGQTVMGSQSGPMAMYALGMERGCEVFAQAVDHAVKQHLPQWRTNLIKSYRDSVPQEELAEAVDASPRAARAQLGSFMTKIGSTMRTASEPLLTQAHTEVITEMSNEAGKVSRDSIDAAQRQRELQQMVAERQICGVVPADKGA